MKSKNIFRMVVALIFFAAAIATLIRQNYLIAIVFAVAACAFLYFGLVRNNRMEDQSGSNFSAADEDR